MKDRSRNSDPLHDTYVSSSRADAGKATRTQQLQRRARAGAGEERDAARTSALAAEGVAGAGERLPFMDVIQRSFGHHRIEDVRAHTGASAGAAAEAIGADAFATGRDVAFADPAPSLALVSHEAAHVVQQRAGVSLKNGVGEAGDAYEQHADAVADAVVRGESAAALLDQMAPGAAGAGSAAVQAKKKKKSPIVYLGMNSGAAKEAARLRKGNKDRGGVEAIINDKDTDDQFTDEAGTTHDLNDATDMETMVESWGLTDAQEQGLVALVVAQTSQTKDEVFKLAKVYAEAELGKRTFERLVLSGHSFGDEIFGEGAWMDLEVLVKLRDLFPGAAGQVKHLMMSACSSGYERNMDFYRSVFPNLVTATGYAGSCPSGSGARSQLAKWERQTDDDKEKRVKPVAKVMGTWSQDDGYNGPITTLEDDVFDVEFMEDVFQEHLDGTKEVTSSSTGPMYTYFRSLMRLLGRTDLPDTERLKWEARMELVKRLRFWQEVKVKFGATYATRLEKGYKAIGRAVPAWDKLTRIGTFAEVAAFESAAKDDAKDALYLMTGLRDLDGAIVLESWL